MDKDKDKENESKDKSGPDFPTLMFNLGRASGPLEAFKESFFCFTEEQRHRYEKFVEEQLATGDVKYGFCGGNFSIKFTPTGLGLCVEATCNSNDVSIDLSEDWH